MTPIVSPFASTSATSHSVAEQRRSRRRRQPPMRSSSAARPARRANGPITPSRNAHVRHAIGSGNASSSDCAADAPQRRPRLRVGRRRVDRSPQLDANANAWNEPANSLHARQNGSSLSMPGTPCAGTVAIVVGGSQRTAALVVASVAGSWRGRASVVVVVTSRPSTRRRRGSPASTAPPIDRRAACQRHRPLPPLQPAACRSYDRRRRLTDQHTDCARRTRRTVPHRHRSWRFDAAGSADGMLGP